MSKVKITIIKKFSPIDVFGHEVYSTSGTKVTTCGAFEEGQEFIVEHIDKMPEGFCGKCQRDFVVGHGGISTKIFLYFILTGIFMDLKREFNIHLVQTEVNQYVLS